MLSLEAHGFYTLMLDYLWLNDGELPADDRYLAKLLRVDVRTFRRHLSITSGELLGEVSEFFSIANGKIINKRMAREVSKAVEKTKKAKKSADKRWGCERISERNANQKPQPELLLRNSAQAQKKPTDGFDRWWDAYPRKKDKPRALKTWRAANLEERADELIQILENQKALEPQWREKKYIPYPATYLNGERWNDEIDTGSAEQPRYETSYERAQRELEQWENGSGGVLENDGADVPRGLVVNLRPGTE